MSRVACRVSPPDTAAPPVVLRGTDPKVLAEVSENLGEAMVGVGAVQEDDTLVRFRERGD